jgi:hypothetical protein
VNPVGRPIVASEAPQPEIVKHGALDRQEMSLSRRTVTTISTA